MTRPSRGIQMIKMLKGRNMGRINEEHMGTCNVILPCVRFQTSALQQSKVNLTWDETDVARTKTTMRQ